jgi:hypothetical protein
MSKPSFDWASRLPRRVAEELVAVVAAVLHAEFRHLRGDGDPLGLAAVDDGLVFFYAGAEIVFVFGHGSCLLVQIARRRERNSGNACIPTLYTVPHGTGPVGPRAGTARPPWKSPLSALFNVVASVHWITTAPGTAGNEKRVANTDGFVKAGAGCSVYRDGGFW